MFDIDVYVARLLGANDPTLRESIIQSSKLIALGIPNDPPFLNSLEGIVLYLGGIFVPESRREGWMKLAKTLAESATQEAISVGDRVEVFGLESAVHNGLRGTVVVMCGSRLEVVLETAEVARFKFGNVRKIPEHIENDSDLSKMEYHGIKSLLSFVLLSLYHRTCALLTCTCPAHPCPLFSLRVIFISRVLLQHLQPLLGHSCRDVQNLSIKVMWRLFQFYAVLPPCNRFQALAMQPPSEKKLLGFLNHSFSRKTCLSILNVLLELATSKVSLPTILSAESISPAKPDTIATTSDDVSVTEETPGDDSGHGSWKMSRTDSPSTPTTDLGSLLSISFSWKQQSTIDLFRCKVENACLLPHIFRLVARAGERDRLEAMKIMFSMLVGKALSVETVLQMKKWPFWILEIMAALPASVLHAPPRLSPSSKQVVDEKEASANANSEILTHCVAFFEFIMTYAFKNFSGHKFAYLLCDTLALIRRFSGGWTSKSLAVARKILAVVMKRAVADHRLIKNEVDGPRWNNSVHLVGIVVQFALFVGDDDSPRKEERKEEEPNSLRPLLLKARDSTLNLSLTLSSVTKPKRPGGSHARTWSSSLQSAFATLTPSTSFLSGTSSQVHTTASISALSTSAAPSAPSSASPQKRPAPSALSPLSLPVFSDDASFSPLSNYSFNPTTTFSVSSSLPTSTSCAAIVNTTMEFSINTDSTLSPLSEPSSSPKLPIPSSPEPLAPTEKVIPAGEKLDAPRSSDCLLENHWRTAKKLLWYWDNALDPDLQGVKLHKDGEILLDHPLISDARGLFKLLHMDDPNMFGDLPERKLRLDVENKLYKFVDRIDALFTVNTGSDLTEFVKENKKMLNKWSKLIGYTFATIEDRGLMEGILRVPNNGNKDYFFSMTPSALRFNEGVQLLPAHKTFTKIPAADCSGGLIPQNAEDDEEKEKSEFEFQLNTPKKSLLVVAQTLEERDGWLALLALLHKKKYAGGGSQRLSSNLLADTALMFGAASAVRIGEEGVAGFVHEGVAPVWVTKQDVTQCHSCKATFSLVRLKHWCRICGQVFCHSCCKEKLLLPMYLEPQRVCRTCVVERQRVEHRKKVELMKMMHYRSNVMFKIKDEYLEERKRLLQPE